MNAQMGCTPTPTSNGTVTAIGAPKPVMPRKKLAPTQPKASTRRRLLEVWASMPMCRRSKAPASRETGDDEDCVPHALHRLQAYQVHRGAEEAEGSKVPAGRAT